MLRWTALAGTACMLMAGCGNRRIANKKNLEHALNRDYAASADCLFAKPLPFPYQLPVNDPLVTQTRERLDAMVRAGLLNRAQYIDGNEIVNRYSLTEAGLDTRGDGRFCYGHRHVTSVEQFSDPIDYRGMQVTKVRYRFVLKQSARWAQKPVIRDAFPEVANSLSPEPVAEATLMLTREDGWVLTY